MPATRRSKKVIVKEDLCNKIMSGLFRPGDIFPNIGELSQKYNISTRTAATILQELGQDGFLDMARGRRTRIASTAGKLTKVFFEKPIAVIHPVANLCSIANWRNWLRTDLISRLQHAGCRVECPPENVMDEPGQLDKYSGVIVAGELVSTGRWLTLQQSKIPCVKLSFLRPYPNSVYVDYRNALDQLALYLAGQHCHRVIMLACSELEAKNATNWFSDLGVMKTLQDYNVDDFGFQRMAITSGDAASWKRISDVYNAASAKTAFLVSNPEYSGPIAELMTKYKKHLGTDYQIISLCRAPHEQIYGEYIDPKCEEISKTMVDMLIQHKTTQQSQLGKVILAEFKS